MIDTSKIQANKKSERIYIRAIQCLEILFLLLTGFYLFTRVLSITTFLIPVGGLDAWLPKALLATSLVHLFLVGTRRWTAWLSLVLAADFYFIFRKTGYIEIVYLAALTIGFSGMNYRKVLKTFLISVGACFLIAIIAALSGAITNFVYPRAGYGLRSAWGICYPTDFATLALFLVLILWATWRKLSDWEALFFCAVSIAISAFIAHSRTSTICGGILLVMMLYHGLEDWYTRNHPEHVRLNKCVNCLLVSAFPLCALVMLAVMLLYSRGTNIGFKLDNLMSGRLKYIFEAWQMHGLKVFGAFFEQIGNGFSLVKPDGYNFIDSSYPLMLMRYGWVFTLLTGALWCRTTWCAIRNKDKRLALAMALIAFHSFSEHHFLESHYNILLAMPFAAFEGLSGDTKVEKADKKDTWATLITVAVCAALTLTLPGFFSKAQSFFEAKGLCGGGQKATTVIAMITGMLCVVCGAVAAFYNVVRRLLHRSGGKTFALYATALVLCVALLGGAHAFTERVIASDFEAKSAMIEADRPALEIVMASATGKVYAGVNPELYQKSFTSIRDSLYTGEELARLYDTTTLMNASKEYSAFISNGFLYTKISDRHALYTSDRSVIEALTDAGYHLTGYYSNTSEVNLARLAEMNNLTYVRGEGVALDGPIEAISSGPYWNVYAGKYTLTYELSLPEYASREPGRVCTLRVAAYSGQEVLLEKEVTMDRFDAEGKAAISIPFTSKDYQNVEFLALTEADRQVNVTRISCVRTPDLDVHRFLDSKMREIRTEYYDLSGEPAVTSGGYHAIEKEYDFYGNVKCQRYYDRDNALTMHTSGYAELRRTYNAKRQIVREAYYGTDGAPIALTSRAAINEREYDSDGNVIVNRYYGIDGKPVMTTSGYAELHRKFDEDKHVIQEAYFGVEGEPIPLSTRQYAIEQEFDTNDNVTVRRFYGENGELMLRTDGYAEVHWQYNGMHQVIREEFYDTEGEPVVCSNRYAADEREYDDAGNVIVYRYYDTDGQPTIMKSGYAELHRTYNDKRKVVREEYYDTDGAPIALSAGQCAIENTYDGDGNVSVRRFLGPDGMPVLRSDGYAEVHWAYNGMRQVVREEFFGTDGQRIAINTGQAINEREYDAAGNVTVYRYFDAQCQPVVTTSGYAEIHRAYNERRQIVREEYYGTDGLPMIQSEGHCAIENEYDDKGNAAIIRYYDGDGELISICNGYAEIHRTYNNKKQVIREAYFDTEGKPYIRAAGHVAIEQEFDDKGELAVRSYLDAQGKPMERIDGYSEARWTYDENNVRNVAFYNLNGEEIPIEGLNLAMDSPDGWSKWYTPKVDTVNYCENFTNANLGNKGVGDTYTLQIEVEFEKATATQGQQFAFRTQGSVGGDWTIGNVWNSKLLYLDTPPEDGIYRYSITQQINEKNAVGNMFNLGFRCDNWACGRFRIRLLKVERGSEIKVWTPGI